MEKFYNRIDELLLQNYRKTPETASVKQLYEAISQAAMEQLLEHWAPTGGKRVAYLSAEFLMGRLFQSNLMNMGLLGGCSRYLADHDIDVASFEEIEDTALGNGGLGRLAACFLDSAAAQGIPLDGYGIRYRYGLFRQRFEDGAQKEEPDNWLRFGDPWSIRRDEESVRIDFGDLSVNAVPYDMPVIGWGGRTINTLRLWQSEPVEEFDLAAFNCQQYSEAWAQRDRAEAISAVLYPNDDTEEGKRLRLRQQYFFAAASVRCMVRRHIEQGENIYTFAEKNAIQLNDTHPVVAIPELMRILMGEHHLPYEDAMSIVRKTFAYTNHTIMPEALEKWDVQLFATLLPEVYPYIVAIQNGLCRELRASGISKKELPRFAIVEKGRIAMANLAVFSTHSTNGVACIHTQILKDSVLSQWHKLYPTRINNKTNGITQRRWLALCNPELSALISELVGGGWITHLDRLEKLTDYCHNAFVLDRFMGIKHQKKQQLADYIFHKEGIRLNPDFIFDIQIKRLHEYKRQLLNALAILDTYFAIKEGSIVDFAPTAWIFGAKSAASYRRAKGIIKFINEVGKLVNNDPATKAFMQVVFVQNYNVSYAEKLIPAADVSEQISLAGTEASGTGNMKLMLNGAVTLGTLDGANVEIVEQSGIENNYIFGATVEEIKQIAPTYDPVQRYLYNPRIKRALDTLIDGTLDDGNTGDFRELYNSILKGASWHKPDQYYLLLDFDAYCDTRLRLNRDYCNRLDFARKGLVNTAHAGKFSSDRTVAEYAKEIWQV
ncbi:MAG: glycogen/starch/alpha-glucan phosphorylase [Angelakisella sp.]